ncbi:MAG: diguanylate cyclase [Oscillospiraceae bacterium]|nr:diguanylate cyclase [Oscillospiraceae bacterium]
MKKRFVKLKILISMISVALLCCVLVMLISVYAYGENVQRFLFESAENKKDSIQLWISNIMENAHGAAADLSIRSDFKDAIINKNTEVLSNLTNPIASREAYDYGIVTDHNGNVLFRTYDVEYAAGNLMHLDQIILALEGTADSSVTRSERGSLIISSVVPVYGATDNIIGTVAFGRTLDDIHLAYMLKLLTDCEITIFDGSAKISSTMHFSSIELLPDNIRDEIINDVLINGLTFRDELQFVNISILSIIYPLYGTTGDIEGMMLIGLNSDRVFNEVRSFALRCSLITLLILAVMVLLSFIISGNIDKQFTTMINDMTHRETLLEAVNHASVILLEIDETDEIKDPLVSSMVVLGNAMSCDHVHLWQANTTEDDCTRFVRNYSWVSDYAKSRTKAPKSITIVNDFNKLDWMNKFLSGEYISGIISEMPQNYQEHLEPLHTKSITMIPVFLENQFWGMFSIDFINKEAVFQENEVAIFRSVSLMMANIVRRHDLQSENLKVYTDALTGIHNRRFFDKSMRRIISSLSRTGGELSLMMIDIDYFKKYNDTYGHGPGDECLIKVAEILTDSVQRVDDFVARYGGEEFVAVLPNTDKGGAIAVAEKMLENVKTAGIEHKASEVAKHVTFSIGITTGIVNQHHTIESFLQSADNFLYESKNDGRNRYTHGEMDDKA